MVVDSLDPRAVVAGGNHSFRGKLRYCVGALSVSLSHGRFAIRAGNFGVLP